MAVTAGADGGAGTEGIDVGVVGSAAGVSGTLLVRLLAGAMSGCVDDVTLAVLVMGDVAVTLAVTVNVTVAPAARLPMFHTPVPLL